jgi:hypothetical protein
MRENKDVNRAKSSQDFSPVFLELFSVDKKSYVFLTSASAFVHPAEIQSGRLDDFCHLLVGGQQEWIVDQVQSF